MTILIFNQCNLNWHDPTENASVMNNNNNKNNNCWELSNVVTSNFTTFKSTTFGSAVIY